MNRGTCGTIALNDVMQKLLNGGEKPQFTVGERLYKLNDKLMQTVNNYDKSVFNGDLGTLVRINTAEKKFTVQFDGTRDVEYNFDESDQLRAPTPLPYTNRRGVNSRRWSCRSCRSTI
ncbi:MAG: hypothetical protein J6C40_14430 [Lentisphaeria bacterium]|nr:hypothetical protein [Lentisphaeria bacterium]